ncbi:MAG: DUF4942 domain-containing protein [Shewanella sp.]
MSNSNYYSTTYYPTPRAVIERMFEGIDIKGKTVLDPSAGMGAILDYVRYSNASNFKQYAIEIDFNFQKSLQGKGYNVIDSDFLQYSGTHSFDLIMMNPPFDQGCKHLLKAISIARGGCKIVCLLNEETLKNPHTLERKDLLNKIDQMGGEVSFIGSAFDTSERKTGVGVAMVKITMPSAVKGFDFDFNANNAPVIDMQNTSEDAGLQRYDKIKAYCDAYNNAINSVQDLYDSINRFSLYAGAFCDKYACDKMITCFSSVVTDRKESYSQAHNILALSLQEVAWSKIFSESRISSILTEKARKDFEEKRVAMGGYDLNPSNINAAFGAILGQMGNIQSQCISDAFDLVTRASEKNRGYFGESWKTNSHYMVCSKFILQFYDRWFIPGCHAHRTISDLDRALCMISGVSFVDIKSSASELRDCFGLGRIIKDETESHFFTMKIFKKGTVHFKFKDESLRAEFNRRACEARGWQLPESETFSGKQRRK